MAGRGPVSSTNPFRKSLAAAPAPAATAPPLSPATAASIFDSSEPPRPHSILHTSRPPSSGRGRSKKVRVQSPPSSADSSRSPSPRGWAHELEFERDVGDLEKNEAWPIKLHLEGEEEGRLVAAEARAAGGAGLAESEPPIRTELLAGTYAPRPAPSQSPGRVPPNPFSRTLQDMEQTRGSYPPPSGTQDATKSLDVDAFKRLLLTGTAEAPAAQSPTAAPAPRPPIRPHWSSSSETTAESAGGTNTMTPPPVPAPRRSKPPPPPPPARQSRYSRPESKDLGRSSTLGVPDASPGRSLRDIQKPPPPLPTSRRNSDCLPPEPESPSPAPGLSSQSPPTSATPIKPPVPRRESKTDAPSRPVPPPPVAPASLDGNTASSTESSALDRRASLDSIRSRAESIRGGPQTPAPAPPPPRRHSSRRSVALALSTPTQRNPSPAPSAAPSDVEKSPVLLSPAMLSPAPGAPGSASSLSQRSMESIRSAANLASLAAAGAGPQPPMPPPPPPPPVRSVRAPRPTSRHEGSFNRDNLPPPPPPPPPARRGTNRGSVDGGKKLAAAVDVARRQPAPDAGGDAVPDAGQGKNILADIEALQRDLDAFRGQQ